MSLDNGNILARLFPVGRACGVESSEQKELEEGSSRYWFNTTRSVGK